MMAGNQGQHSDSSYFSSLLKLWDLDDIDVDDKLLLETAASKPLLNLSNTCTAELGTSTHGSTLSATVEPRKSDAADVFVPDLVTDNPNDMSHSVSDPTLVCSACENCNELGSNWCKECGRALIKSSLDIDGATSSFDCNRKESASLSRAQDRPHQGGSNVNPATYGDLEATDPIRKVQLLSDERYLSRRAAEPGHDHHKLNSQYVKPSEDSCSDRHVTLQKPGDPFDVSEIQLVTQAVSCTHSQYSTAGDIKVHKLQSQKSPHNLSTCIHQAYTHLTPGLSQTTLDDDPPGPSSQETVQECNAVYVYHRRWNTSSSYMWRKPTTLKSKVLSPSATCNTILHHAGTTFQAKTDGSINSHSKCNKSSNAVPNRSERQLLTPCTSLSSTSDIEVPSKVRQLKVTCYIPVRHISHILLLCACAV